MKNNLRISALAASFAVAALASATPVDVLDILHGGSFPDSTFGVYLLGETMPWTSSMTQTTRDAGPYAVSPNMTTDFAGNNQFYFAGVSDGWTDSATPPLSGRQDLLGFYVNYDPSNPSTLRDVTSYRVANAQGAAANTVNQFATNSVANDGTIALKMGIGSGNSNGFGTIPATNAALVVFGTAGASGTAITQYTPNAGTGFNLLGASGTVSFNVPSIGGNNNIIFNANFNRQVTASNPIYAGGAYLATTLVLGAIGAGSTDNRGSITYNDRAGLAAVLRTKQTATVGMAPINHVTAVAVYKVVIDWMTQIPTLYKLDCTPDTTGLGTEIPLPQNVATVGGKQLDLVGTNYFGRSPFVGPAQIAMNDNGDISLATVAVDVTDLTDTGQNQERGSRTDRRILVADFDRTTCTYGGWICAAQSGVNAANLVAGDIVVGPGSGDFVSVNPVSGVNSIATGNPSLDNDGNVYFAGATEAVIFGTGGTTVRSALFRAERSGPVYAPVTRLLAEGDVVDDSVNSISRLVTFIPLATATSDLTNANIRFPAGNSFNPGSGLRDSGGGVTLACRMTDGSGIPTNPTRWNFLWIAYR